MSSNLILLICLLIGFGIGFFFRFNIAGPVQKLLTATIIILIFIMGASLGLMPDLGVRIVRYGYSAFVITGLAMLFSALTVFIIMKTLGRKRGED